MGAPIARRLAEAGHEVRAWNRTPEKANLPGVAAMATAAEAVEGAEAIVTMLSDGPAVESVIRMPESLPAGALWIQTSTVGAAAADRLGSIAAERGLVYVDAPVLGSKSHAEGGELFVLASGPADAQARCEPLFAALARRVEWLGEAGVGSRLKLAFNNWILCTLENLAETLALTQALGVDPARFLAILDGEPFDMRYAQLKGPMMLAREFPAAFPLRLARKDLALVLEDAARVDLPLVEAALAQFERADELGHGDEDASAVSLATAP
jgi:3-hydroxyisobutyrate dehydrogenase